MVHDSIAQIKLGLQEIYTVPELEDRLKAGKPLKIKAGFDPTAPDLHFGHLVLFNKLRQLQDLGHIVQFLIGDFTAVIGDPTGKSATRVPLTEAEIAQNAKTYTDQVFKILNKDRTELHFNSQWLSALSSKELIQLCYHSTVARMLEREDFEKRYRSGAPIALAEFLYPLLQGYDSVVLKSDIELGGTDQLFNLLMGRTLQKHFGQSPQVVLTLPLLIGLDGEKKMSKSLGNYIALLDPPFEMFGKIMSLSDKLMWDYFTLLSMRKPSELNSLQQEAARGRNPRDIKIELAIELVSRLHSATEAEDAHQQFLAQFSRKELPSDIETMTISLQGDTLPLVLAMKQSGLTASTSEAIRAIQQGGVLVNSLKITDKDYKLAVGKVFLVQIGKRRFLNIKLEKQ